MIQIIFSILQKSFLFQTKIRDYATKIKEMKCSNCGHWNRISVNKIFVEPDSPEPKVKVLIPMYEPLEVSKCKKYGNVIAGPDYAFIRLVLWEKASSFGRHNLSSVAFKLTTYKGQFLRCSSSSLNLAVYLGNQ